LQSRDVATFLALAKLALNRAQLLAEEELPLGLRETLLGLGGDLLAERAHGQLVLEELDDDAAEMDATAAVWEGTCMMIAGNSGGEAGGPDISVESGMVKSSTSSPVASDSVFACVAGSEKEV
jgi:hypothetical protein